MHVYNATAPVFRRVVFGNNKTETIDLAASAATFIRQLADQPDVGRSYEAIVRVNSQSGKGGIAFLLERDYGVVLPKRLQVEFSQVVQRVMDRTGQGISSTAIWQLLRQTYAPESVPLAYESHHLATTGDTNQLQLWLRQGETQQQCQASGNGPIEALVSGLGRVGLT